jgi:mono/diheme cytochrome c family protein
MKTFAIDGRLIETRLLMRFNESTWRGFSYEWDDAETEATLVPDGKNRVLGDQTWHYPSPAECLQCHTSAAGRTLGLTTFQLDTDNVYGGEPENQIDHLESLGAFESPPPRLGAYPDPALTDGASLEDRARAYLAVNCSICHRPGGALDDVDLRFSTPFAGTQLCDEPILRGTGDIALPQIRLTPGSPDESSLAFRMHDTGSYRMPKIGSSVVDPEGTALIDDWIRSIGTCP